MLTIETLVEAMALHRAITQAKFAELDPIDSAIPFSEPLSNIARRNLDSIIAYHHEHNENMEAGLWTKSRQLKSEWKGFQYIKQRIEATSSWANYNEDEKIKLIEILCSPFVPSESQIKEFLRIGNET